MAENVTTLLVKPEIEYDELVASTLTKFLYLMHGSGSDRDRILALSTLAKYILEGVGDGLFDDVGIQGILSLDGDPASTEIVKGRVTTSSATSKSEMTTLGIEVSGTPSDPVTALTKNGVTVGSDTVIDKDRVIANGFRVKTIISESSDYNGLPKQQAQSGNDKLGDIALVMNTSSSNIKVYISRSSGGGGSDTYVSVNAGCCIQFICISEASQNIYSEWAPMSNMQIY